MQKSARLIFLAAIFLIGLALASEENTEVTPTERKSMLNILFEDSRRVQENPVFRRVSIRRGDSNEDSEAGQEEYSEPEEEEEDEFEEYEGDDEDLLDDYRRNKGKKGGKGHHGKGKGKGKKHHGKGGKKNFCKKVQHKCAKTNNNHNARNLLRKQAAAAPAVTNVSQLCDLDTCEAFITNHHCYKKCAKDCHHNNKEDEAAALTCKNGCLTCVDEPKNETSNPTNTSNTTSNHTNTTIRAVIAAARHYQDVTAETSIRRKSTILPIVRVKGKFKPPKPEQFCAGISMSPVCSEDSDDTDAGSRIAVEEYCDQGQCVEFLNTHEQCFWGCGKQCEDEHKGDFVAMDDCLMQTCWDCEEPAPARHRVVRRHLNRH